MTSARPGQTRHLITPYNAVTAAKYSQGNIQPSPPQWCWFFSIIYNSLHSYKSTCTWMQNWASLIWTKWRHVHVYIVWLYRIYCQNHGRPSLARFYEHRWTWCKQYNIIHSKYSQSESLLRHVNKNGEIKFVHEIHSIRYRVDGFLSAVVCSQLVTVYTC